MLDEVERKLPQRDAWSDAFEKAGFDVMAACARLVADYDSGSAQRYLMV